MKQIKKIVDMLAHQKINMLTVALNSHLSWHKEHDKDIEELRDQCDIAYKEHLKHIHSEPKQVKTYNIGEAGYELHEDGAVTTSMKPKQEEVALYPAWASEPKQEYCSCKDRLENCITRKGETYFCSGCGLPLPTKQECRCYSGYDKQGVLHLHQCDKCGGLPLPTNTKEEVQKKIRKILKKVAGEKQQIDANTDSWVIYDDSWEELEDQLLALLIK
jgi:hypothetical protein